LVKSPGAGYNGRMKESLEIEGLKGEQTLMGEIPVYGSKNAALIAFPMTLLFKGPVQIINVPEIEDVHRIIELMKSLGISVEQTKKHEYRVEVSETTSHTLDSSVVGKIRASVFLAIPLLARFGEVVLPHPGGDNIGPRPIDLFIEGLEKMGATCDTQKDHYHIQTPSGKLKGAEIFLKIQSVGATQSLMLAAVLAEGTTVIKNAAMEPEIVSIAEYLVANGADIKGIGTTTLTIKGTGLLESKQPYRVIPDRLEAGTFLILGVLSGKDITITDCDPSHIEVLTDVLKRNTTSEITIKKDTIRVENKEPLKVQPINIRTHEYPGFASDLQPPLVVLLTQAGGKSLVFETIFEERFSYTGNLVQMGAKIVTYDPHRVRVHGKTPLKGSVVSSPDIRAGLAYVLAAIVAEGTSVIHNVYCIDRGYEQIEERLRALGVTIQRT